jgi:predicted ATPase
MLKRIYIDNFRCFVNFDYKPEGKQLLLGGNGSGKSSLLEALRLLKEFIKGRDIPFTQSSRTRWQDRPLQVFEIDALVEKDMTFTYRVEIRHSPKSNAPSVSLERLSLGRRQFLNWRTERCGPIWRERLRGPSFAARPQNLHCT